MDLGPKKHTSRIEVSRSTPAKCVSMAIKSFLKSVTTLTCVRFHIFVFICDGCSIYNVVRLTVLRWQGTWMVSAIAAWARRWFLLIFHYFFVMSADFNFKTWHTFIRNFDAVSVHYFP